MENPKPQGYIIKLLLGHPTGDCLQACQQKRVAFSDTCGLVEAWHALTHKLLLKVCWFVYCIVNPPPSPPKRRFPQRVSRRIRVFQITGILVRSLLFEQRRSDAGLSGHSQKLQVFVKRSSGSMPPTQFRACFRFPNDMGAMKSTQSFRTSHLRI